MQQEAKIEDSGSSCPSFSCYSSDSSASSMAAATKVIHEQQQQQGASSRFHDFQGGVVNEEDFEFLVLNDDDDRVSPDEMIGSRSWTVFPVFNRNFEPKNDGKNDVSDSITGTLRKLFIDEPEESSSSSSSFSSSSEADELESLPSGTYCVWRPNNKSDEEKITKCKKSSSTGSGSGSNKRWRIRYLLRRSNSEGKVVEEHHNHPMLFVKQKRSSGEASRTSGRLLKLKSPPAHEQFYVQKRAENEMVKRRSYLPYRQDLVGLFVNHNNNNNRMGKMLPF